MQRLRHSRNAKKRPRAKVEEEEVEEEEEAKAEEPNAKKRPRAKAGAKAEAQPNAKKRPSQTKAQANQAVLSPVSKEPDTTKPTWQQRHVYNQRRGAYPGKAGALAKEQQMQLKQTNGSPESFALFLNSTIPRDAPYGYKPDWSSCPESVFKRVESHSQVDANTRAQVGITWTAMAAKLSCGAGFAQGEADLANALERRDVVVRNGVDYEPPHIGVS